MILFLFAFLTLLILRCLLQSSCIVNIFSFFLYFFLPFPTCLSFHLFRFLLYLFFFVYHILLVETRVEESHAENNKVVYFPS